MDSLSETQAREILEAIKAVAAGNVERRQTGSDSEIKQIVKDLAGSVKEITSNQAMLQQNMMQLQSDFREMTRGQQELVGRLIKIETRTEESGKSQSKDTDMTWKWVGLIGVVITLLLAIFKDVIVKK